MHARSNNIMDDTKKREQKQDKQSLLCKGTYKDARTTTLYEKIRGIKRVYTNCVNVLT